jgi:hypothetical protein
MAARTLYEKIWSSHVIRDYDDGSSLIYVDRHLLHEVSTPQSFLAMEGKGRTLHRKGANLAVPDHAVPTVDRDKPIADPLARAQTQRLVENVARHDIPFIPLDDVRPGHRSRDRAGAGLYLAGHHACLWRQSHLDSRRLRGTCLRHRRIGMRHRYGRPGSASASVKDHASHDRRRA